MRSLRFSVRLMRSAFALYTPYAPHALRGAAHRERVVTREEEALYLASAGELMADVAVVLIDTGLRPEDNFPIAMGVRQLDEWAARHAAGDSRKNCSSAQDASP
jgi:hypothetical protein